MSAMSVQQSIPQLRTEAANQELKEVIQGLSDNEKPFLQLALDVIQLLSVNNQMPLSKNNNQLPFIKLTCTSGDILKCTDIIKKCDGSKFNGVCKILEKCGILAKVDPSHDYGKRDSFYTVVSFEHRLQVLGYYNNAIPNALVNT